MSIRAHWFFSAMAVTSLVGCAALTSSAGPEAPVPAYRVGDRWVYGAADGFLQKSNWTETHEITGVSGAGITVRITQRGEGIDNVRTEQWSAPGLVSVGAVYDHETRRFMTPLQRYNFPLAPGSVWNQWVDNVNETANTRGAINRYVAVGGWEKITTPAGTFDAIQLRIVMHLDDDEFWRWPTTCNYLVWYAPAVRAVVRAKREAGYVEKGGLDVATVWTQHAVLELRTFTLGA